MPLPLLACLDAIGDEAALRIAVAKAQVEDANGPVFRDRFTLRAIPLALAVTSRISPQDNAYWRAWTNRNTACAVDAAVDSADRMPGIIHALSEISLGLSLFRGFCVRRRAGCRRPGALMSRIPVAIVGAGPYALSLAAHLAARNVEHRIFGRPMLFWSQIAEAGADRYLKSYCFGTNISTPARGFSFADYSAPRGLETFEPCSIGDFAAYGLWFSTKKNSLG